MRHLWTSNYTLMDFKVLIPKTRVILIGSCAMLYIITMRTTWHIVTVYKWHLTKALYSAFSLLWNLIRLALSTTHSVLIIHTYAFIYSYICNFIHNCKVIYAWGYICNHIWLIHIIKCYGTEMKWWLIWKWYKIIRKIWHMKNILRKLSQ